MTDRGVSGGLASYPGSLGAEEPPKSLGTRLVVAMHDHQAMPLALIMHERYAISSVSSYNNSWEC